MRTFVVTLLILLSFSPAQAALITVTVTNPDATGANGLQDAIDTVNASDPGDIYVIEISLPEATPVIDLQSPLPAITQRAVTIRGTRTRAEGLNRIDGGALGSIITMGGSDAIVYSIENLRLENSNGSCAVMVASTVIVDNSEFVDCPPDIGGGSALRIIGQGTIRNSDFDGNVKRCPQGLCRGGAVDAREGTLTVESSSFTNNRAISLDGRLSRGGAIIAYDGVDISDSYFAFNYAGEFSPGAAEGGALWVWGNALIYKSVFQQNVSVAQDGVLGSGGAIYHRPDASISRTLLRVWNSYFSSNSAAGFGRGGALYQFPDGTNASTVDIRNATFVFNRADESGSDFFMPAAADEVIYHSVLGSQGSACVKDGSSAPLTGGWNLLGNGTSCNVGGISTGTIQLGDSITIGRLNFRPLDRFSPAIDAGNPAPSDFNDPSTCRPRDLTGRPRPLAGPSGNSAVCDIGAQEFVLDALFSDRFGN